MSVQIEMTPSKMSTCSVSENQPIYQALLDKAASYPADKPYQAKTYKKAAESVLTHTWNIYDIAKNNSWYQGQGQHIPGAGEGIRTFIKDFIKTEVFPSEKYSEKAANAARNAAAAAAPKNVTTWPNDDAERAAFQVKLAASKIIESAPVQEAFNQLRTAIGLPPKPVETVRAAWSWANYLESMKPVVYTAENPRRSKRNAGKPKVQYFTEEDQHDNEVEDDSDEEYIDVDDDVAETIEAVCSKKGWTYSDELVTDFEAWLPTADKYALEKYDYKTGKYIPRTKLEVAKYWAQNYSSSLQKQKKQLTLNKSLIKYCQKNNIQYDTKMADKFAVWMADPTNKKLITSTYTGYNGCSCASCNPNGEKRESKEYSYDRSPVYCINKWFSTLKKSIVW